MKKERQKLENFLRVVNFLESDDQSSGYCDPSLMNNGQRKSHQPSDNLVMPNFYYCDILSIFHGYIIRRT